jgi:hypothetical protein
MAPGTFLAQHRDRMSDETDKKAKGLSKALTHVLEECRMVLPGIQALFGFQLIAVFSVGFHERLAFPGQALHLASILLVVLSIALVMTPAAYHRQCIPEGVSEDFIRLASRLLLWSMVPLGVATCIEVFLIASIILGHFGGAAAIAIALASVFLALWLVLPKLHANVGIDRSGEAPLKVQPHTG